MVYAKTTGKGSIHQGDEIVVSDENGSFTKMTVKSVDRKEGQATAQNDDSICGLAFREASKGGEWELDYIAKKQRRSAVVKETRDDFGSSQVTPVHKTSAKNGDSEKQPSSPST